MSAGVRQQQPMIKRQKTDHHINYSQSESPLVNSFSLLHSKESVQPQTNHSVSEILNEKSIEISSAKPFVSSSNRSFKYHSNHMI